jgi:hypothetical protein
MTQSDQSRSASPNPDQQTVVAARLRARRERVRAIRRRVAGLAAATFLATSGVIFAQLVTGNDPALARKTTTVTPSSSPSSASSPSAVTTSAS